MAGYLITWNPLRYKWDTLEDNITEFKKRGRLTVCWSCGVTKKIRSGDRIFMFRQGVEPRGIMASGWAVSDVFEYEHWGFEGKSANYIYVMFDSILNPDIDKILKRELLDKDILGEMHWNTQSSGISIDADIIAELEKYGLSFRAVCM